MNSNLPIAIIGGGPAGLFCAYQLLKRGYGVDLYDHSTGLGKKFLVAGNGGLNLTHSEDLNVFSKRYGKDQKTFEKLLADFSPTDLRDWCAELGIKTFVGSSGRVFPEKLNAAEILLNWTKKLKSYPKFNLYLNHSLVKIGKDKKLTFKKSDIEITAKADLIILAMGGASWKKTGSTGAWQSMIEDLDLKFNQFLPMNCGFERPWSDYLISNIERTPLKNIIITHGDHFVRGELMITSFGIEGGGIYALSNHIRDAIIAKGSTSITLDLRPDLSVEAIIEKLKNRKKKESLSNHLRKKLNIDKKVFIFLKEVLKSSDFDDIEKFAYKIKNIEIELFKTRPLDEAISTSGGVCFSELNEFMELKKISGIYMAGEMLDFEAPTGGYLLQGCFSTAWAIIKGICSL